MLQFVATVPMLFQRVTMSGGDSVRQQRDMKAAKKDARRKFTAAELRSWRVSIIRKRGQYLGTVDAPDEKAAEVAAMAEFDLSDEQRRRLLVQERN
jgi:hypothetical protein